MTSETSRTWRKMSPETKEVLKAMNIDLSIYI